MPCLEYCILMSPASTIAPSHVLFQVEGAIDSVVDDAVNAILQEEDEEGAERVVEELKELEEKVIEAAADAITNEQEESEIRIR